MSPNNILTTNDFIIGSGLTILMAFLFSIGGGLPLMITFVPGLGLTWIAYYYMYSREIELPELSRFMPFFFVVLAWQFLHFNEEFLTDFKTKFPLLYGSSPYSNEKFVSLNMVAYFTFAISCVLFLKTRLKFLLIPALFFITYGAIGNAIAHTWWSIRLMDYFPGVLTAQVYWFLWPWILYKLIPDKRFIIRFMVGFAILLILLLTLFMKLE